MGMAGNLHYNAAPCPGDEIGRRNGLKIRGRKRHAGSSPAPGTNFGHLMNRCLGDHELYIIYIMRTFIFRNIGRLTTMTKKATGRTRLI